MATNLRIMQCVSMYYKREQGEWRENTWITAPPIPILAQQALTPQDLYPQNNNRQLARAGCKVADTFPPFHTYATQTLAEPFPEPETAVALELLNPAGGDRAAAAERSARLIFVFSGVVGIGVMACASPFPPPAITIALVEVGTGVSVGGGVLAELSVADDVLLFGVVLAVLPDVSVCWRGGQC